MNRVSKDAEVSRTILIIKVKIKRKLKLITTIVPILNSEKM